MIRQILKILVALALVGQLISCGFTPPVAGPNMAPSESAGLVELPLVSVGEEDQVDYSLGEGDVQISITATPSKIYTLDLTDGLITSDTASIIRVVSGIFAPDSEVDIWGEVSNAEEITSPPYVGGGDRDPKRPNIQLLTASDGSIQFTFVAGYSPGTFRIVVSDGEGLELSVAVLIQGPEVF